MAERPCQKRGCGQAATHALQIGCGEVHDPDDAPPRAKVLIGVLVCEAHLEAEDASRWLDPNPSLRQVLAVALGEGAAPDFERAVILGVPVDSAEYQNLLLESLKSRGH